MRQLIRPAYCKEVWLLLLFFVLFFLLRLPSLIEPYWYGDEGVYETLAVGMDQGRLLYRDIWDNKTPLLYVTFALFNADQFWVRLASLTVGALSFVSFFCLAHSLFKALKPAILSTLVYTILFALPTIEGNIANAENFMLLPIITAGLLIYKTAVSETKQVFYFLTARTALFSAGILLGIAFLFKIVAIFDLAAFASFLFIFSIPHTKNKDKIVHSVLLISKSLLFLFAGFIIPFLISVLYFLIQGGLESYIQAIFFSNVGYVGYHNEFLFPQGLLVTKVLAVALFSAILLWKRAHTNKAVLFIGLWVAWGLFNAYFSQRPYTHYLLVLLPSFSLVVGLLGTKLLKKAVVIISIAVLLLLAQHSFYHWDLKKTVLYYDNFATFINGKKSVQEYQSFFDRRVPRDMAVVSYLNSHAQKDDSVFLWGNNPQIYALIEKAPPGRFTVAYHILGSKENIKETEMALKNANPKYIVIFPGIQSIPFPMYNYTHAITLNSIEIYERFN